jgi:hypothetical protein
VDTQELEARPEKYVGTGSNKFKKISIRELSRQHPPTLIEKNISIDITRPDRGPGGDEEYEIEIRGAGEEIER